MSAFLLYHPKTRTTGRALAKLLGIHSGTMCRRAYDTCKTIIRWGNIRDIKATYLNGNGGYSSREEINKRGSVQLAGSKYRALERLQDRGVNVPPFWKTGEYPAGGGIMLCRNYRHSRGTDIQIVTDLHNARQFDYITEYIKPNKEYRVHVMNGECILAQRKYFRKELWQNIYNKMVGGGIDSTDLEVSPNAERFRLETDIIRNNEHGWGFHDMNNLANMPKDVISTAIAAVAALGLDFGAVDLITADKKEDGVRKVFVLEVNTAPGLRERNLQIYAKALRSLL